jgi:hypothetical protein
MEPITPYDLDHWMKDGVLSDLSLWGNGFWPDEAEHWKILASNLREEPAQEQFSDSEKNDSDSENRGDRTALHGPGHFKFPGPLAARKFPRCILFFCLDLMTLVSLFSGSESRA